MKNAKIPHSNADIEAPPGFFQGSTLVFDARTNSDQGLEFMASTIRISEEKGFGVKSIVQTSVEHNGKDYPSVRITMERIR